MNTLTIANATSRATLSGTLEPRIAPRGKTAQVRARTLKSSDAEERQVQEMLATFTARWEW